VTNTLDEGGGYDEEDEEEGGEPNPSRHGRPRSDRIGVFGSVREGVGWVRPCVYKQQQQQSSTTNDCNKVHRKFVIRFVKRKSSDRWDP
jgi:hypothetical protein